MLPILEARGLATSGKRLGTGVHRTGYRVADSFVIKLANGINGREANRNEAEGWNIVRTTRPDDADLFAPVIAADPGGEWVVMPLCQEQGRWHGGSDRILALLNEGIVCDLHPGNVMLLDGRPVITDYGFGIGVASVCGLGFDTPVTPYEGDVPCFCSECVPERGDTAACLVSWGHIIAQCETCQWFIGVAPCRCSGCQRHLDGRHNLRPTKR